MCNGHFTKHDCHPVKLTQYIFCQKYDLVNCILVVDDFGLKYIGNNSKHNATVVREKYKIETDLGENSYP